MQTIDTEKQLLKFLKNRPDVTTTYQVSERVFGRIPHDGGPPLGVMTDAEVRELGEYLEAPVETLKGPFRVAETKCSKCGRHTSFLDFVKTAVDHGSHDRAQLRDVLTGKAGSWITIRGKDGGRPSHVPVLA